MAFYLRTGSETKRIGVKLLIMHIRISILSQKTNQNPVIFYYQFVNFIHVNYLNSTDTLFVSFNMCSCDSPLPQKEQIN